MLRGGGPIPVVGCRTNSRRVYRRREGTHQDAESQSLQRSVLPRMGKRGRPHHRDGATPAQPTHLSRLQFRRNQLGAISLDHVALLEIGELGNLNAALEVLSNFAHVVLEAPQRLESRHPRRPPSRASREPWSCA